MKIVFNCHVEYDLKNQFGWAKAINSEKQSFVHLSLLLDWLSSLKMPITFSLAVGGPVKDRLLKYIQEKGVKISPQSELAIHYHSEQFKENHWQANSFLNQSAYADYYQQFKEIFGLGPKSMVFGKWQIDYSAMNFLWQIGIKKDGSFVNPQKIITQPFLIDNILEVPVVSFQGQPVNPLTRLSHFFLLRKIIKKYYSKNLILHLGFHSYDFFSFKGQPQLRLIKKIIFKNILKLIRQYNLEITTLSKIAEDNFTELDKIKMPLLGKLFSYLGH